MGTQPAEVDELLKTVAMTLLSSVGGASGPLYGTFFLRFGSGRLGQRTRSCGFATGCAPGLAGILERGKAEIGDKTMVDALSPALDEMDAVIKKGGDLDTAVTRARDAAAAGRDATVPWSPARVGQATLASAARSHGSGAASMSPCSSTPSAEFGARRGWWGLSLSPTAQTWLARRWVWLWRC